MGSLTLLMYASVYVAPAAAQAVHPMHAGDRTIDDAGKRPRGLCSLCQRRRMLPGTLFSVFIHLPWLKVYTYTLRTSTQRVRDAFGVRPLAHPWRDCPHILPGMGSVALHRPDMPATDSVFKF